MNLLLCRCKAVCDCGLCADFYAHDCHKLVDRWKDVYGNVLTVVRQEGELRRKELFYRHIMQEHGVWFTPSTSYSISFESTELTTGLAVFDPLGHPTTIAHIVEHWVGTQLTGHLCLLANGLWQFSGQCRPVRHQAASVEDVRRRYASKTNFAVDVVGLPGPLLGPEPVLRHQLGRA